MNIVTLVVVLLYTGGAISTAQKCSSFCTCDIWQGLRRAVCAHRNLFNIVTNVPERVEVLDLSFNSIKFIEDNAFQGKLASMKQLNLSRNHIQHISRKAFDGLTQLKTLDLSYNHIKYLLNDIFLGIPQLEILILSGNDFSRIKSGPLLEAPSLKVLYLSRCRIDNLKVDTFTNIPNVVGLDLSGNYLAQLETAALRELQNLEKIDLSRNRWHCDNKTKELTTWLTDRNIDYTPICEEKDQVSKDEEEFSIKPSDDEVEIIGGSKFWPNEDKLADMNEKLKFQNKSEPIYILQEKFRYFFYITHLFDAIPSFWAFVMGFQVGTVFAIFGTLLMICICRRRTPRPRPPVRHRWSERRRGRMRSTGSNGTPWTELQTLDCPDTPPPPYKDINVPNNNVLMYT